MKSLINKSFALVVAAVFFVSSTGVVLASHICMKGSHKSVSLFDNKGCCSKKGKCEDRPETNNTFSSKCCVTEFTFHKVNASSVPISYEKNFSADNLVSILPIFIPETFKLFSGFLSSHRPPSFTSGTQLLLSIHRLQV